MKDFNKCANTCDLSLQDLDKILNFFSGSQQNLTLQDLDKMLKNLKGHMSQLQHGGRKRKNVNYEVRKEI